VTVRLAGILAVAAALASCGGGSSSSASQGTATFSGTIRGTTMTPRDASAAVVSFSANGVPGKAAVMVITSASAICSQLTSGKEPKSTQYLVLTPFKIQPDFSAIPPPTPGVYTVGALTIENAVRLRRHRLGDLRRSGLRQRRFARRPGNPQLPVANVPYRAARSFPFSD
jgi:hypothetical protein